MYIYETPTKEKMRWREMERSPAAPEPPIHCMLNRRLRDVWKFTFHPRSYNDTLSSRYDLQTGEGIRLYRRSELSYPAFLLERRTGTESNWIKIKGRSRSIDIYVTYRWKKGKKWQVNAITRASSYPVKRPFNSAGRNFRLTLSYEV